MKLIMPVSIRYVLLEKSIKVFSNPILDSNTTNVLKNILIFPTEDI